MDDNKNEPANDAVETKKKTPKTFEEIHAPAIKARMAAGLTKDQAIECEKVQAAWDEDPANTADKPKGAKAGK